jgi:hypothetical protein
MKFRVYNLGALNLKISPFVQKEGELIQAVNIERDTFPAWKKRPGYTTYLGTPDNAQVNSLFSWTKNDNSLYTYRYSGSVLYYSTQGTGDWTVCGNGTFTGGALIGHAVLDDVMITGDGTAATRHTSTGTSFTNTTSAPLASLFEEYQGRIYAARGTATSGVNTDLFYSTIGTASNWTADSSSIRVPGAGRIIGLFKANDRLVATKDSGNIFRWDGYNLIDLTTNLGPSSFQSVGSVEDYRVYLNRRGVFGYGGGKPELLSNAIERQIYNDSGSAIAGTTFDNAPGIVHKYDWFCSVGTITDDLTDETISNAILKYDVQHNEFVNWQFNNRPTAFHSYKDATGVEQFIFGDSGGQCYQLSGTATSDNNTTIEAKLQGVLNFGVPESDKKFNFVWAFTNPGAEAKIQVAIGDTFTKGTKKWVDLKQVTDGVMEARFPQGSRGKLLFWRLYESSRYVRFNFYGFTVDAEVIER